MACNSKTQTQFVNQGVDYEKLLQDAIQEIKKLRDENEKLKAEIKQLNEALYENDDWNAGIISNLKEEMKELKKRMENLENMVVDDEIVYPEAETEEEAQWFDVKDDDDYEIKNIYPYDIRRKKDDKIIGEYLNKQSGYINVRLGKKYCSKHILVAKHFIPNPEHLPIVDHKNHIRTDYHISNLRWVSAKENSRNKYGINGVAYEYVDDIPEEAMKIEYYDIKNGERRIFKDNQYFYFYDDQTNEDKFYGRITENIYRVLNIIETKSGYKYVNMQDENGKVVALVVKRFKYQQGLIE